MEALDLLLNRRSIAKLDAPAPQNEALDNILRAGLRAPDHGALTPWRFVVAQGEGLAKLAAILEQAEIANGSDEAVISKAKNAPFRAPMVITVIAKVTHSEKIPAFEQHLSSLLCSTSHANGGHSTRVSGNLALWKLDVPSGCPSCFQCTRRRSHCRFSLSWDSRDYGS